MTIQAAVGLGLANDPGNATKEAMIMASAKIKSLKIDLAFVFCASVPDYTSVVEAVSESLGGVVLIGCSTAAILSQNQISKNGVAVALLHFPGTAHFYTDYTARAAGETSLRSGEKLGEKLLNGFQDIHRSLGIIFSDGLTEDRSNFLYGLQEKMGQSFPVIGASASDNVRYPKTAVYRKRDISNNAACGVLLGGRMNFGLGVKHGWKPLGKPRYATKVADNVLYEIDGRPAVGIYEEYLAANRNTLQKELKHISVLYPIGIYLPGEEEYLLRNVSRIEDNGALVLHGEIGQGDEIRLMIGTKESCLAATQQAVDDVKWGLKNQAPNFILVLNSIARHTLLGRLAYQEIEIIKKGLGEDVPIVGIYTYAGQAPLKAVDYRGRSYTHNQTLTILAIKGVG